MITFNIFVARKMREPPDTIISQLSITVARRRLGYKQLGKELEEKVEVRQFFLKLLFARFGTLSYTPAASTIGSLKQAGSPAGRRPNR